MNSVLQRQFRTFIRINRWRQKHVTASGNLLLLVACISLTGLFAIDSPLIPLGCGIAALMTISGIGSFLFRPRLSGQLRAPSKVQRGEVVRLRLTLTNKSRLPAFDLEFDLEGCPESWRPGAERPAITALGPGESTTVQLSARPLRRGAFSWSVVRCGSCFPFRLFQWRSTLPLAGELLVLPTCRPLHEIEPLLSAATHLGDEFQQAAHSGDSTDYLGAREYQPGVPVRRWDYSSWARTGAPAVREFEDAQRGSVGLIVDLCVEDVEQDRAFEAMLSLCASLADAAIANDRQVQSVYLGNERFSPGAFAGGQQDQIMEALALVQCTTEDALPQLIDRLDFEPTAADSIFFISSHWDEQREKLHTRLDAHGANVFTLLVVESDQPAPTSSVRVLTVDQIDSLPEDL